MRSGGKKGAVGGVQSVPSADPTKICYETTALDGSGKKRTICIPKAVASPAASPAAPASAPVVAPGAVVAAPPPVVSTTAGAPSAYVPPPGATAPVIVIRGNPGQIKPGALCSFVEELSFRRENTQRWEDKSIGQKIVYAGAKGISYVAWPAEQGYRLVGAVDSVVTPAVGSVFGASDQTLEGWERDRNTAGQWGIRTGLTAAAIYGTNFAGLYRNPAYTGRRMAFWRGWKVPALERDELFSQALRRSGRTAAGNWQYGVAAFAVASGALHSTEVITDHIPGVRSLHDGPRKAVDVGVGLGLVAASSVYIGHEYAAYFGAAPKRQQEVQMLLGSSPLTLKQRIAFEAEYATLAALPTLTVAQAQRGSELEYLLDAAPFPAYSQWQADRVAFQAEYQALEAIPALARNGAQKERFAALQKLLATKVPSVEVIKGWQREKKMLEGLGAARSASQTARIAEIDGYLANVAGDVHVQSWERELRSLAHISKRSTVKWMAFWLAVYTYIDVLKSQKRALTAIDGIEGWKTYIPGLKWKWEYYNPDLWTNYFTSWAGTAPLWTLAAIESRKSADRMNNWLFKNGGSADVKPFTPVERAEIDVFTTRAASATTRLEWAGAQAGRLGKAVKFSFNKARRRYDTLLFLNGIVISSVVGRANAVARGYKNENVLNAASVRMFFSRGLNTVAVAPVMNMGIRPSNFGYYLAGMTTVIPAYDVCNERQEALSQLVERNMREYKQTTDPQRRLEIQVRMRTFEAAAFDPEAPKGDGGAEYGSIKALLDKEAIPLFEIRYEPSPQMSAAEGGWKDMSAELMNTAETATAALTDAEIDQALAEMGIGPNESPDIERIKELAAEAALEMNGGDDPDHSSGPWGETTLRGGRELFHLPIKGS